MQGYTSIPFKAESGLSSVNGVAKISSAGIVLEFESKLFGIISDGVKEARISVGDIHDIKFKKGVFKRGAKIEIRLNSFAQLAKIPNKEGKIILKLFPDDVKRAGDAVAGLQKEMSEHSAGLPPPHPPIASLFDESENETKDLKDKD